MHIVIRKMVSKQQKAKKQWSSLEVPTEIPKGVTAKYEAGVLTLTGPKGEVSKRLKYPNVYVEVKGDEILIGTKFLTQRETKIIFTYVAHCKNLIKGATEGFEYKLAVVYAKFPISVDCDGKTLTVKNLLGEKVPRKTSFPSDVKVEVKGKDITVSGINKEKVGQVAASIEQLTRITHLDRRVIQDGIYIVEKPHRRYV